MGLCQVCGGIGWKKPTNWESPDNVQIKNFKTLYQFAGYKIDRVELGEEQARIVLECDARFGLRCPCCGGKPGLNRQSRSEAIDLPLGPLKSVVIDFPVVQVKCSGCGECSSLRPPGIDPSARATVRLMRAVSWACRYLPLDEVQGLYAVSASTARRYDKTILQRELPEPNLDGLVTLLVDEKAVRKRHGYVTLVMNGDTGELLHMSEGKKKQSLQEFFDRLSPEQKATIEAVAMDRSGAYHACVKENLPDAVIVFDRFHVVASFNAALDELRRMEWRRAQEEHKKVIKGARFLLFGNTENLDNSERHRLRELLKLIEPLATAHILKDALKQLWTYIYPKAASNYLQRWCCQARDSGIAQMTKFAKALMKAHDEIVAFCHYPITTAKLESFNTLVARIVRKSCGVSDLEYLFLKLRQEALGTSIRSAKLA